MKNGILPLAGVFMAAALGLSALYTYGTADTATFTVTDKERVMTSSTDSNGNSSVSSKYLIFSEHETFENTDSLLKGKFNSSDVYGKLHRGKTYICEVYGWRIPFLSNYRNIVSCAEAKPAPAGR